jgi:hypothetical protein
MAVTKEIVLEVGLKDSTAQGTTSAKQRLRELQKTLTEMALAGESGTKAFKQMEQEAGKLKDQIGDTSQRIKNLASDTRNIDTFVAGIQGITAGFQIAQGAAALFGSENEDLQKALLKVQGAMALANGVQQVANLLNKDSILITQGQAAAQALYATAVGASTGAMKAFRIALLATGIGAAIAAVGLLVAKWDELTAAVRRFLNLPDPAIAAKAREDAALREEAALSNYRDAYEKHTEAQIEANKKREAEDKKNAEARRLMMEEQARSRAIMDETEVMQAKTTADALVQITADQNSKQDALNIQSMLAERERRKKFNDDMKANELALAEFKKQVTVDSLQSVQSILQSFGNESKGLALAALALEKGLAIANVIVSLQKEMAANAVMAAGNPANAVTAGAAGVAQLKAYNTLSKIRAGLRIAAITAAGIQGAKAITGGGDSGGVPAGSAGGGGAPGAAAAPSIFANPNVTDLSGFGQGQGQGSSPMRAYVVERDITQSTRRVRRLEEFATLGA